MTPYVLTIAILLVVMFVASVSASKEMCDVGVAQLINLVVALASGALLIAGFLVFTVIGISGVFG